MHKKGEKGNDGDTRAVVLLKEPTERRPQELLYHIHGFILLQMYFVYQKQ